MSRHDPRQALFDALEGACTAGVFPGCVALVWADGALRYHEAHGVLATHPAAGVAVRAPVERETVYDLASLTKVLSTTTLLAAEVAAGRLDLAAPLPAPFDRACPGASFADLLAHRGGLVPHREFFVGRAPGEVESLMADLLGTPRQAAPGEQTAYSDLGFIILGAWLEAHTGQALDTLFDQRVARPLYLDLDNDRARASKASAGARLAQLGYRRVSREAWLARELETRVAPTEVYDTSLHEGEAPSHLSFRAQTCDEAIAHGRVHDDNTVVLDGVAGHAGLFGQAQGVLEVARAWLDANALGLDAATRDLFWRAPGGDQIRRLGWDGRSPDGSGSTAGVLSEQAVGHLGFTGTSLWIDPPQRAVYLLLSNRVHPTRTQPGKIRELRRDFHRLAVQLPA